MHPDQELMDAIYRDKVLRARRMKPEDKLFAGAELFDHVSQIMTAGIRNEYPELDEDGVRKELRRRFEIYRLVSNQR